MRQPCLPGLLQGSDELLEFFVAVQILIKTWKTLEHLYESRSPTTHHMQGTEKYLNAARTFLLGTLDSGLCLLVRSVVHGDLVPVLSDIKCKVLQQPSKVSLIKSVHQAPQKLCCLVRTRTCPMTANPISPMSDMTVPSDCLRSPEVSVLVWRCVAIGLGRAGQIGHALLLCWCLWCCYSGYTQRAAC